MMDWIFSGIGVAIGFAVGQFVLGVGFLALVGLFFVIIYFGAKFLDRWNQRRKRR